MSDNVIQLSALQRSDEELDFFGDLYAAASIRERLGITFARFLERPYSHLGDCGQSDAPDKLRLGLRPLLPKQEAVIMKLHAGWDSQNHPAVCPESRKPDLSPQCV